MHGGDGSGIAHREGEFGTATQGRSGALNTSSASQQATSALAQQVDNVDNLLNENLSIQPLYTDSH